jgi:hypothetical protein
MTMNNIIWTLDKRRRFTQIVWDMLKQDMDRDTVFVFDGHKFVLGYAQYLCDYLNRNSVIMPSVSEPRRSYERSKGGR